MRSEKTLETFGKYSIDFLGILYRLFPDTSIQTLEQHGGYAPFVWENRSVSSEEKSVNVRELVNEGALRWGGAFGERESTIGESACEDALRWGGVFGERDQQ